MQKEFEEEYLDGPLNTEYEDNRINRVAHDDQVIPALNKKNPAGYIEERPEQSNLVQEAEELSGSNQRLAESIAPIVGAEMCKKIFSKHWNLREEALNTLIAELPKQNSSKVINYTDDAAVFLALTAIVSYTIGDRLPQISARAMTLLKALMTQKTPNITAKTELAGFIDTITNALMEKLGDNNIRIKDQAEEVLLIMARNTLVTCNYCVNAVIKGGPTGKYKGGATPKHIVSRLKVLQAIIKEFKINNHDVPYHPVLEYTTEKFEHPNADVRSNALSLLVDIYNLIGDKLKDDLDGMKLVHIEVLRKELDAAAGKPIANSQKGDAKLAKGSLSKKTGDPKPGQVKNNENEKTLNGKNDGKGSSSNASDLKNKLINVKGNTVDGRESASGKGDIKQADQQQPKPGQDQVKGDVKK